MASAEDKIVRMVFDNASFEKKISSTIASLGQLEKSLKLSGATKGFSDIDAAAKKIDMSTISNGIEGVSRKFLALSAVAITVLANITTKALEAGTQIVKSLSIDPILDGLKEYELNMNSIQTILSNTASKGTTLDDVSRALDQLNRYADLTIYNFAEMARNIGTFTAAGVDLQTSVDSIKGIANLAALSGSNAGQAATAMYQLSQAIATGTVKLIDWNSVVNAGIGGEVFQSALFETGKALGTLTDVPVEQTFQQWKDAGNSFRESLQDGWITAEVLTTTLQGFTGDMTEEMLLAQGYNEQQAAQILKMAEIAKSAATEVKTFTQLWSTVMEAVGTGWADSFRIVVGNFEEAKELWTNVNNSIGDFISKTSTSRNELLQGWKDLGGRTKLIEALTSAFHTLGEIMRTVGEAFRNVFPPVTAENLIKLTESFSDFVTEMIPSVDTINKMRHIFTGFFSALAIGWEIIKQGVVFLVKLGKAIADAFGGTTVELLTKASNGFIALKESLVDDGRIAAFFNGLAKALEKPIKFLAALAGILGDVFKALFGFGSSGAEEAVSRLSDRFNQLFSSLRVGLANTLGRIAEPLKNLFNNVVDALEDVWVGVKEWFSTLGERISKAMQNENFDEVLDVINTGLLGGITLLIANFFKKGFSFNFDVGSGLLQKVGAAFQQLTGVLSAMQTEIKANALLKIAGAIAVLTASVLVLSIIDSASLSRALSAMAVGFGQLIASFTLLTKIITDPKTAISFTTAAVGLILLSAAMFGLAISVSMLSSLEWEEIGKGLASVLGLIAILAGGTKALTVSSKGMITVGAGLIGLAIAMVILAGAMKIFATMSWEEIGKGLTGVAGGLVIIAGATRLMPSGPFMLAIGASLIGVSIAMNILAGAMKIFATMSWEEIGKGMVGVAGGLLIIAGALNLMPVTTPIIAAGLIAVSIALVGIAEAMKIFSTLSWDEIGRSMVAMAGSLLILAGALFLMGQTAGGAVALVVAAVGLGILGKVLKSFAKLGWDELTHGLIAIGIALAAIAGASLLLSPAVPAILALAAALLVLGLAFALLGGGLYLLSEALKTIGDLGEGFAKNLQEIMVVIVKQIPLVLKTLAVGLLEMLQVFVDAAPQLLKAFSQLLGLLLDAAIENLPKLGKLVYQVIGQILSILRRRGPEYIRTGIFLILSLLKGIRQKIDNIVRVVADIIEAFINALADEVPRLAEAYGNLLITVFNTAAYTVGRVAGTLLFSIGQQFMQGLFDGINANSGGVFEWFAQLPGKVLTLIGDVARTLWQKGVDLLSGLVNGIVSYEQALWNFWRNLPGTILGYFGDAIDWLRTKGLDIIQGLFNGLTQKWGEAISWLANLPSEIIGKFPDPLHLLWVTGKFIMQGLWEGLKAIWVKVEAWLKSLPNKISNYFLGPFDISSPSKYMIKMGGYIMEGFRIGMAKEWDKTEDWMNKTRPADMMEDAFSGSMVKVLTAISQKMSDISEFAPTITPVLDLTKVKNDAEGLNKIFSDAASLVPAVSYGHARTIANTRTNADSPDATNGTGGGVSFEQNIYSPTQLSTSDIYKNTRNQIQLAKDELEIP